MPIEPSKKDLINLYSIKKYSAAKIAKIYGFKSKKSIINRLRKHNINVRSCRESENLVGLKFHDLIVIGLSHTYNKTSFWLCKCICGNEKIFARQYLLNKAKSCGCHLKRERFNVKDLLGKRFGKLTAIKFINTNGGHAYWKFKCDCGTTKVLQGSLVSSGKTTHCGCKNDLSGRKFGKLRVLGRDKRVDNRNSYWVCQCECGNVKTIQRPGLISGEIISCGCSKSYYEELLLHIVKEIFHDEMFNVLHNYSGFDWLYREETKSYQHIDIVVFENNKVKFLIEYDGKQHFEPVRFGGICIEEAERKFTYQKKMDERKNRLAREMGFVLVRFSYKEEISKKYIMDKLSRY
jgi:hypothetical protein